ncbi:MAG: hypothetical protein HYR85_11800 [Planctomycetes bacterium]|nr:hypothetical protein [Planctomycetota bacterium]MBI3843968.1 hypothetical protein [Planctomycetota bacterium]
MQPLSCLFIAASLFAQETPRHDARLKVGEIASGKLTGEGTGLAGHGGYSVTNAVVLSVH